MSGTLPLEMVVRDFTQFLVDKGNESLKSLPVSGSPLHQEFAYGLKRHVHSSSRWGIRQTIASRGCQVNPTNRAMQNVTRGEAVETRRMYPSSNHKNLMERFGVGKGGEVGMLAVDVRATP